MVGQDVEGPQQGLGDFVGQLHLAGTDLVHHRFEDVGETDQVFQPEGPCAALHRVDGAEDGIDRLVIRLAQLHGQQALFGVGQEFIALLEERLFDALERIQRNAPKRLLEGQAATRRTASTSFTGLKGFTIQPVAPAERARSFLAASLSVVRTRIGVAR